jgi:hypothetical protein
MSQPDPTLPPLLAETVQLLRNRPARIKLREISAACDVSIRWLSQMQKHPTRLINTALGKVNAVNVWLKEQRSNAA